MGGPEIPLRIAGPADLVGVTALIEGFRDFLSSGRPTRPQIERILADLLEDPATEFLLVGEPAGGFAQVRYRVSVWNGDGSEDAWLEDVFVNESARGRGFGRTLMEGVIARAEARGAARIQLDANRRNTAALALYESLGFAPSHNPAKWGDGEDLFYTLDLD